MTKKVIDVTNLYVVALCIVTIFTRKSASLVYASAFTLLFPDKKLKDISQISYTINHTCVTSKFLLKIVLIIGHAYFNKPESF